MTILSGTTTMTVSRPRLIFYVIGAIIALAGLADATYLTVLHLTGDSIVCGGSAECSKVLGSVYSHIGPVPVAALGVLGYYAAFSFATYAAFGYARAARLLVWIVWVMFAVTLWFLFVQMFLLHAFCRFCLLSAAIVFLLAGIVVAMPPIRETEDALQ